MAIKKTIQPRGTKKTESIRDKASKVPKSKPERRRIHSAVSKFSFIGVFIKSILRPFDKKPVRKTLHIIGLILWPRYFRGAWSELRLVIWPSNRETRKLTSAVIVFAFVFGAIISITDYGLDKVFKKFILK